ncbi:MAG: DUF692 domain-containing protein, partial [Nevskia sp.]|nr:DUF692 domain-containing protein [Nevskia sp.]
MKVATKMSGKVSGLALATAAAAMFLAAPMAYAGDTAASTGKCVGGNACKGQSACKGAKNSCKGQNSCKGEGFTMATKEDCAKAGGKMDAPQYVRCGPAAREGGRSFCFLQGPNLMNAPDRAALPQLGFGLGLRTDHYEAIVQESPRVDWFEAISENYLVGGGKPLRWLERIRERYPVVLHGVSLSIGSTAPLDRAHLIGLKALAERIQPAWISDHLCWTGVAGRNLHDLMPLPHTEEAVHHVAARVREVQDFLGRRILLENVSSYVDFRHSVLPEWEFLRAVA